MQLSADPGATAIAAHETGAGHGVFPESWRQTMFVAPLSLPRSAQSRPAAARRSRPAPPRTTRGPRRADVVRETRWPIERAAVRNMLYAWLLAGCAVALLFPQCLTSRSLGAGAVFWLVGAPLLDLAWLSRARLLTVLRRVFARARPHAQARRL